MSRNLINRSSTFNIFSFAGRGSLSDLLTAPRILSGIVMMALLITPILGFGKPLQKAKATTSVIWTVQETPIFLPAGNANGSVATCGTPGALDPSFGTGGKAFTAVGEGSARAHAAALQPDGKIIVAGTAEPVINGGLEFTLVRYNPDGSLDDGFGAGGKVTTSIAIFDTISALALQPDGKIVAAGWSQSEAGEDFAVARYNTDGTLDTSFGTGGKLVTDFGSVSDRAYAVTMQPDGRIITAGTAKVTFSQKFALARYNSDGSLDGAFGSGGKVTTDVLAGDHAFGLALQNDGKIVAVGETAASVSALVRYNADGSIDNTFSGDGKLTLQGQGARAVVIQPDNRILIAGNASGDFMVARINTDGTMDASFGAEGIATADLGTNGYATSMALLPDGRILAAGIKDAGGGADFATLRYNPNGTLDMTFGTGGKVFTPLLPGYDDIANALVLQPDGRIVAAGFNQPPDVHSKFAVVRYLGNSCSAEITVSEGVTYRTDGESLGFGTGSVGSPQPPRTFTIRNDGTEPLTIGAVIADGPNSGDFAVNTAGMATTLATGASTTFSATFTPGGPGSRAAVLHVENNDPDETSFDLNMTGRGLSGVIYTLNVSSAHGNVASAPSGISCPGDCSESFDEGAEAVLTLTAATRVGYRFIGWSGDASGSANPLAVAVNANKSITAVFVPITLFDYEGDSRADFSVFRPSNSTWYFQTSTTFSSRHFGAEGDIVTPADFDGDRKTDIALYRPSTGTWYYVGSAQQTYNIVNWGQEGDYPVPMDRAGTGISRPAVYRASAGKFMILGSSENGQFNANSVPVRGDFDGDGRHDAAVYQPATYVWQIIKSGGGTFTTAWGESGDIVAASDYDGDGATDVAVWRPSTGTWYIIGSSAGWMFRHWGEAGDIPVPADYDGDGSSDLAVFRPSNGMWYIINSSDSSFYVRHFGETGDIPVPSAYNY